MHRIYAVTGGYAQLNAVAKSIGPLLLLNRNAPAVMNIVVGADSRSGVCLGNLRRRAEAQHRHPAGDAVGGRIRAAVAVFAVNLAIQPKRIWNRRSGVEEIAGRRN